MARSLADVITDEEQVFANLLAAQRKLEGFSRAGGQMGIVDGETSDMDTVLAAVHAAQHRLDALSAEALQAALSPKD
jgi:hypothetical protein